MMFLRFLFTRDASSRKRKQTWWMSEASIIGYPYIAAQANFPILYFDMADCKAFARKHSQEVMAYDLVSWKKVRVNTHFPVPTQKTTAGTGIRRIWIPSIIFCWITILHLENAFWPEFFICQNYICGDVLRTFYQNGKPCRTFSIDGGYSFTGISRRWWTSLKIN